MLVTGGAFRASHIVTAADSRRFRSLNISPRSKLSSSLSWPRRKPRRLTVISAKRSSHKPGAADQLRLGGLAEDGLSYKERFVVRSYEVGMNKMITIQVVANFLQEVACNHFLSVGFTAGDGFSSTNLMRKLNLIMVLSRLHIEVYKYPAWNEVMEIESWIQIEGNIGFRCQWILKDYSTGEVIGWATGKWLLMNQETRRFHRVVNDIRDEVQKHTAKMPRDAFPDENKAWLKKIEKLDDPPHYSKLGFESKQADLDMNMHVNNASYIGWLLESIPSEVAFNYELQCLTIDYRRECQYGDIIDSLTSPESDEAGSMHQGVINGCTPCEGDANVYLKFRHLLRLSGNGAETCRARTNWRRKIC